MKIVIVNAHISDCVGGSELQCDIIARGLSARGHEVHYIAVKGEGAPAETTYAVHPVPHSGTAIGRMCARIAPDVVYWRYNKFCFYRAARIIASSGIPIVFSVSAVADTEKWGSSGITRRRSGLKGLLKVIKAMVLSRWNYQGFRFVAELVVNNPDHLHRAPVKRQRYIPNGMIVERVEFQWDREFVVWIANIKQGKRPEAFVELAGELTLQGVDCLMIGRIDDPRYERLKAGVECPENFHFLGALTPEEVNGVLAKAKLHVHTCLPEGFSNVFIQSWLQGCPSVSLSFDPGGYITSEGLGAYSAGKWDQFVEQVQLLLSDDERRQAAGKRAQAFAKKTFSTERLLDQVIDVLEDVVASAAVVRGSQA